MLIGFPCTIAGLAVMAGFVIFSILLATDKIFSISRNAVSHNEIFSS